MKIAIVNHIYLETELSSTTQLQILQALNDLGHPATLVVPFNRNSDSGPAAPGVDRVSIASRHWAVSAALFNLKLLRHLARIIRRDRPDVIMVDHLAVIGAAPYMLLSAISRRFPRFIFDVRSQPVEGTGLSGFLREAEYLTALAVSARVIPGLTFLTRPMGAHELSRVHSTRSYGVWESGVDTTVFEPERWESKGVQLRHELGLDGSFVVFYHGDVSPKRGLDIAVRAFAQLSRTGRAPGASFVILGDGGARQDLERLAQDLGAPVRFLGRVPFSEVPGYIAMSDVALIPLPDRDDWRYQHPLKFTEYLAMNLPAIVPASPAFTAVAGDSEAVEYLADVTPEEIAASVAKCFDNHDQLAWRAKDGRQLAEKFRWDDIASRLVDYAKSLGVA